MRRARCSPSLKRKRGPTGAVISTRPGAATSGLLLSPWGRSPRDENQRPGVKLNRDAVGKGCRTGRTWPGTNWPPKAGHPRGERLRTETHGSPSRRANHGNPRNLEPALGQPWRHQNGNWDGMSRRMTIRQPFDLAPSLETGQAFRWCRVGEEEIRHQDWGDPPARWRRNGGAWYSGVLGEYLVHLR